MNHDRLNEIERETRVNIDVDDNASEILVYTYTRDVYTRIAVSFDLVGTTEPEIEAAARAVGALRDELERLRRVDDACKHMRGGEGSCARCEGTCPPASSSSATRWSCSHCSEALLLTKNDAGELSVDEV